MGIFTHDPARLFFKLSPVWAFIITVAAIPGVMIAFRWYDIKYGRGMPPQIDGYLSWWVIPTFDIIGAPIMIALAVRFSHMTKGLEQTSAASPWWSVIAAIVPIALASFFIATAHSGDWTKAPGANLASLNLYGVYHLSVVFLVFGYIIATFIVRGGALIYANTGEYLTQELKLSYLLPLAIFIVTFIGVQIPDLLVRAGKLITPNGVISFLLGRYFNF